jgi:hypothetical protein
MQKLRPPYRGQDQSVCMRRVIAINVAHAFRALRVRPMSVANGEAVRYPRARVNH